MHMIDKAEELSRLLEAQAHVFAVMKPSHDARMMIAAALLLAAKFYLENTKTEPTKAGFTEGAGRFYALAKEYVGEPD
jgi:hypothetical protein